MKQVIAFSVKYPVTITMFMMAVLLLGVISLGKLGIDLFPELNSPRLFVELKSGERPPEEIEELYVARIEALSARQSDVINVTSVSKVGVAQIVVEYVWGKNMSDAFLELQKALAPLASAEGVDLLEISQHDPNAAPVMLVAMTHDNITDLNELRKTASNYIRNELIRLDGIAEVKVMGEETIEVTVETNDAQLKAYNISIADIANKIQNFNRNLSGGNIVDMGLRYVVKGVSEVQSPADIENIILKVDQPRAANSLTSAVPLRLGEVAKVTFRTKDPENIVRFNGEKAIGLAVYKETKFNTVQSVENLTIALDNLHKSLPGYHFTVVRDQAVFISNAIKELQDSALIGIALAIFVLMFFLRKFYTTLIVGLAIPISIIASFTLIYFNDLTLNLMTLGGLALGSGMLVDNAIVVIESIFRSHESGKSARDAAIEGTSMVAGAIIASTLTTIVVFLPVVYMQDVSGQLFKEQALTITYSLLSSLVVALFLIPMLYSLIYKNKPSFTHSEKGSVQMNGYRTLLGKIIDNRVKVVLGGVLFLVSGYFMLQNVESEFMPKTDPKNFFVHLKMSEGTRLDRTDNAIMGIQNTIKEMAPGSVKMFYAHSGSSSGLSSDETGLFDDQNSATLMVMLNPNSTIKASALMEAVAKYYDGNAEMIVECKVEETELQTLLGSNIAPVTIDIIGEESDQLEKLVAEALIRIDDVKGLSNISTSIEGGAPEVSVVIDRFRAGMLGVDVGTVVNAINEKLDGAVAGQMDLDGEMHDIVIKVEKLTLNQLPAMLIKTANGDVPLGEVATIKRDFSPKEIKHINQNRVVTISAQLNEGVVLGTIAKEINSRLKDMPMPSEYRYKISGEEAQRKASMATLGYALILSLVLVYMVLASQFESFLHPFTILLTIPLALVGAIGIFFIMGKPLNIMAYIGIIMLGGIAVNNSIILIDAINNFKKQGLALREAIIEAGMTRIRPILMTTLTTILALIPLTLGFGEAASLRSPMAWAVIGGMTSSTLLTLVVIPSIYYIFDSWFVKNKSENLTSSITPNS